VVTQYHLLQVLQLLLQLVPLVLQLVLLLFLVHQQHLQQQLLLLLDHLVLPRQFSFFLLA
jgi:hypothetical protein